ncbi:Aspartyl-tRNA(Asn) amidotransferase subunit A @ Glutamyl-tRNA(Gln) amidotransferase subunit A [Alloactinosynnema sp. L-07]|nr:Aspartyl-tRNA(Asn) amidotransferase subunit A @ Glutamyl-tRNA(Gln) amidotransferase subunit A [Alloactinosynnema sp. L-07]
MAAVGTESGDGPAAPGCRTAKFDAVSLAELVHLRVVRPVELVRDAIERIESLDPMLNAVIATGYERAVDTACRMDPDRPFAGVPILIKDLFAEVDGMPCSEGSAFLRGHVSSGDQEYVRRLRVAGFVVMGKTNVPEFGMVPTVEPRLYGPTANPWDLTRTPGGSSGGSAAAVAAGMVPVAHGNDVGGSLRIPASCCGLFGLKPARARNPLGPRYGDAFLGLLTDHVLTRTVRDSAALLDVTAGPAPGDPYRASPHDGAWAAEVGRSPGRLRIAVTRRTPEGHPVHPDCLAALDAAVDLLESLGHHVFERDLTELTPDVGTAIGRMYGASLDWAIRCRAAELGREPAPGDLEPLTQLYWERGRQVTGGDLLLAATTIQRFTREVAAAMADFDLWLSPTLAQPPPFLGAMAGDDPTETERVAAGFVAFPLITANLTGRAAMSVPLFRTAGGLPIGVHLLGSGEATLLRLAAQLEQARPWATDWPPMSTPGLTFA